LQITISVILKDASRISSSGAGHGQVHVFSIVRRLYLGPDNMAVNLIPIERQECLQFSIRDPRKKSL